MAPLRILITNNTLDARAGTELYVYDLAVALLERGHQPVAYSNQLGQVASELRTACVPVIDQLDSLSVTPDIIHGHHHLEAMTAMLHFPHTPAVLFCHSWWYWQEMPVRFPRIGRYLAMNQPTYNRLTCEHGVPEEHVEWLPNFANLNRFQQRSPLPERPARALVFSNHATEVGYLSVIRAACERANLSLDVVGLGVGNVVSKPWEVLGEYDLVFASGRSALEAVATGTAVIVCNHFGLGPMVTAAEIDELRRFNFGSMATLGRPFDLDEVVAQIDRYSASDALAATKKIRAIAGLDATVDRLLDLYAEVIAAHREAPPTADEESRAAATYLRQISDRVKESGQVHQLVAVVSAEIDQLRLLHAASTSELVAVRQTLTFRVRSRLIRVKLLMRLNRLLRHRRH